MGNNNDAAALAIAGLKKSYGDVSVLSDLALTIPRGAIYGLVGLNGSGKTTTIECILGLQRFQAGQVSVSGFAPDQLHNARGKVVAVFDTPSLHPNLTVRQNLELARRLCFEPARSEHDVESMLSISRYAGFKVRQLSLGNKRRTSIAQALLGNPELVVLDEPFNGLDAEGVDDVLQLIQQLNAEAGTSFFLCSHQLVYLEQICTHIAILHKGAIAANGSISELLGHTHNMALLKTEHIAQAQQFINSLPGVACEGMESGFLRIALGDMASARLNEILVAEGIAVTELHLQRASLAGLFRQISSELAP